MKAIPATGRDTYVWDSELKRFGVRVTPTGARYFVVRYRTTGGGSGSKSRRMTIGEFDGLRWNVTKARAKAAKVLAGVDGDQDPFAEREAERQARHLADLAALEAAAAQARAAERQKTETFAAVARRIMERAAEPALSISAPLVVEARAALNWDDAH